MLKVTLVAYLFCFLKADVLPEITQEVGVVLAVLRILCVKRV